MERLEAAREKNNMTLIGKALNLCSVEISHIVQVEMEADVLTL
jgi:S-adenosylmethionine synthetase